ncbi:MAG: FAD-dependent oxidoreductase [Myxococcota bacterium]
MQERPHLPYAFHPSDAGLEPPGHLEGVTFYGFEIQARPEAVAVHLHRTFGHTGIEVRPTGDRVFVVYTSIDRLRSADPERGVLAYNDIALWVPVQLLDRQTGRATGPTVAFWPAYIFVDHPHTMVTGRETFGLAKQMGRFTMPGGPDFSHPLTTDVWGTARRGRDEPIVQQRLWSIERLGTRASTTAPFVGTMTRRMGGLARALPSGHVVGLRQLRDPSDPRFASHGSVVTAPIELRRIHDAGPLPGRYQLRLEWLHSHPVAQDLGLRGSTVPVLAAHWLRADLRMNEGTEQWRAPAPSRPQLHALVPRDPEPRRRVAILGGGIAALTAAWELSEPGVDAEVTVYTRGWRLGGKGASGRNLEQGARIEEHGLHMWYGFYDNAFDLMQRCYGELQRPADHPIATWEQAFQEQSYVVLNEEHEGRWVRWRLNFPRNGRVPGQGDIVGDFWTQARTALGLLRQIFEQLVHDGALPSNGLPPRLRRALTRTVPLDLGRSGIPGAVALHLASKIADRFAEGTRAPATDYAPHRRLAKWMSRHRAWLWRRVEHRLDHDGLRMYWMLVDTATSIFTGLIDDDVITHSLDRLDHLDFRDWLRTHGASEITCNQAPCVRFIYNAGFSFRDGDHHRPDFAAGCALRGVLRLLMTYKGGVLYKMRGGMGDIVFAPMYEALRRRGVRFEFFHSAQNLGLGDDSRTIERIDFDRQAEASDYQPLVDIDGMPCWPSEPDYTQIEGGARLREALRSHGLNLEQCSTPPSFAPRRHTLRRGRDFDDVVLAIPPGAQAAICPELMHAHDRFRAMVEGVPTVGTQAYQLWMKPDLAGLGWNEPSPILGTFVDPVDTWSDMSFLLPIERHEGPVGSLAYFCGVIPTVPDETPPQASARAHELGRRYFEQACPTLWPAIRVGGQTQWQHLADPEERSGPARLDAQYFRANVDGAERYVQSLSGTIQHRLRAGDSGFDNLFLAGDWTDNGFNCGCIEATVISGRQAARALAGLSMEIPGETDAWLADLFGVRSHVTNRHDFPRPAITTESPSLHSQPRAAG